MKQKILEIIANKPKNFSKIIKNDSELNTWVVSNSKVVSVNYSEMIYSALHDVNNICDLGAIKKFNSVNQGYRFCGAAGVCICAAKSVSEKVSSTKKQYSEQKKKHISQKRIKTTLDKYGVTNNGQTLTAKNKHEQYYKSFIRKTRPIKQTAFQKLNNKYKSIASIEFVTPESEYEGVSGHVHYQFKCCECNNIFNDYIDNGHVPKCKICNPYMPSYTSKQENELYEYVKSIVGSNVQKSNKSIINPWELDIVIPDLKIAIEYCGLYWHSEAHKTDKNYHINKMNLCNSKGYRLITIFEDEWVQRQDIVKRRLNNILVRDTKIYARKCQVKTIPISTAKYFIQDVHIQGNAVAKIAYGCYYNDQLIAVMTFGKPRYDKTSDFELIRYCSIGTVIGGASKLFAAFLKDFKPNKVISYCDMRWGTGNVYKKLKFKLSPDHLKPSYAYTDFVNRYHRSIFTKKAIAKNIEDNSKTEHQIMRERKFYRIWDCGHSKWIYDTSLAND